AAGQAAPAGDRRVVDEGAEREHQVVLQVQAAVRPRLAPGRAYHQAQHRVAPAAGHALAVPGEQVVHRVHPGRVHQAQRLGTGGGILDEGQARGAVGRRAPGYAETGVEIRSERGPAAGVTGIQQVMLEVDRHVLARRGQLVTV